MKFVFYIFLAATLAAAVAIGAVQSEKGMASLQVVGNEVAVSIAVELGTGEGLSFQALRWAELGGGDRFDSVRLVCGDDGSPGGSPRELASWTVMPKLIDGWGAFDLGGVDCADCPNLYAEFFVRPAGQSKSGGTDDRPGLGYWSDGQGARCYLGSAADGWLRAHETIGVAVELAGASPVVSSMAKSLLGENGESEDPDKDATIPVTGIGSVWPNPANPQATIRFSAGRVGRYAVAVYDVRGRLVKTLADGVREPGDHVVIWDGRDSQGTGATSGVYFVRLVGPEIVESRQVTLLK